MNLYKNSGNSMGTRFNLLLPEVGKSKGDELFLSVVQELNRLENMLSWFIPSSPVSYLNKHAHKHPVKVEDELFDILVECKKYHQKTFGLFDIGIGKSIEYWKGNQKEVNLNSSFSGSGMNDIVITKKDHMLRFTSSDVQINFGAFGKGYALDKAMEILQKGKITSAFLSFGESSVACLGSHPHGDYWPVGIQDYYRKDKVIKTLKAVDQAVSTSGNLDQENHILNPSTGFPLQEKTVVSVLTDSAAQAEVLSTVFMLADERQIKSILKQYKNVEVIKAIYIKEEVELSEYNSQYEGKH